MSTDKFLKLPSAKGLSRGSTGIAVENLQEFLRRFGYLGPPPGKDPFSNIRRMSPAPTARKGHFDEATHTAVKAYQKFHGIPVTGILDGVTIAQMTKPRCGFPDSPYAKASQAFVTSGTKWEKLDVTFGFGNFTPDLGQAKTVDAISKGLDLWSAVTPLIFLMDDNPEIAISFESGDHGDGKPFDGVGGVLAHALPPGPGTGGDAHFDEAETWSMTSAGIDLITVAAHEFGHSLGLAHSSVPGSLMFPTYSGPHQFLAADDVNGIQSIYGSRGPRMRAFSGFTACKLAGIAYQWSYREMDGMVIINQIAAGGQGFTEKHYGMWSNRFSGFTSIELPTQAYVWAYRESDGIVCIHTINPNGAGFTQTHLNPKWDSDFSGFSGFELVNNAYVWAYRAMDGTVCIHKINANGSGFTQTHMSKWDTNFSGFAAFKLGNEAYVWAYRAMDGTTCIHKINANGSGFTQAHMSKWDSGFSNFAAFKLGNEAYVWAYRATDGTTCIHKINANGSGFTQTHLSTWDTSFTRFTGFQVGNDSYVWAYREPDGTVCIHRINANGLGFTQTHISN